MTLLPVSETRDMSWHYLPELNRSMLGFYRLLLVAAGAGMAGLIFFRVPVSVPMAGTIRPESERTEVHSSVAGIIDSMPVKEGDTIAKGGLLFLLKDVSGPAEAIANETELRRRQDLVADLGLLTQLDSVGDNDLRRLKTALCREQLAAFLVRTEAEGLNLAGARHESALGRVLLSDKIISRKEFYDQEMKENKTRAALGIVRREQRALWQAALVEHRRAVEACLNHRAELRSRSEQLQVKSPVRGVVQGLRSLYPGNAVRPDQPLCSVSPDGLLVGECFVSTRDAGLLHCGQELRIRIDAFNASYFGTLSGHISSVSNDIVTVDGKPAFAVRCVFNREKTGARAVYRGLLRKGLGFQARCIVTERTLFQLLYDNLEDWFSPYTFSSPQTV